MQDEESVCKQLQANMVLCSMKRLREHASFASDVKQITCYGLMVCFPPLPLLLLKLTIDFEKGDYSYQELFRCHELESYPLVVDCTVEYTIKRILIRSVNTPNSSFNDKTCFVVLLLYAIIILLSSKT